MGSADHLRTLLFVGIGSQMNTVHETSAEIADGLDEVGQRLRQTRTRRGLSLAGVAGSYLVGRTLKWPMEMYLESVLVAALFSIDVGVFFGYYPARKASRLDPIEALQYE